MSQTLARQLRKQQTPAEMKLWNVLRDKKLAGYKFRRQFPVGGFIADSACIQHRLIVEADGSQHADNPNDLVRTRELEKLGWHVLRFWNNEILGDTEGVLLRILSELDKA